MQVFPERGLSIQFSAAHGSFSDEESGRDFIIEETRLNALQNLVSLTHPSFFQVLVEVVRVLSIHFDPPILRLLAADPAGIFDAVNKGVLQTILIGEGAQFWGIVSAIKYHLVEVIFLLRLVQVEVENDAEGLVPENRLLIQFEPILVLDQLLGVVFEEGVDLLKVLVEVAVSRYLLVVRGRLLEVPHIVSVQGDFEEVLLGQQLLS